MPGGEHEAVAVRPGGVRGRVAQVASSTGRRPSGPCPWARPGARSWPAGRRRWTRVRMVSTASRSSWSVGRVIAVSGCAGRIGGTADAGGAAGSAARSAARGHRTAPVRPVARRHPVTGVSCRHMPSPSAPSRTPPRAARRRPAVAPAVVVLGDLVVDVVLAPDRDLKRGTDVTGRVVLRQGGSAASTARWLGRLGARSTLVCAIGRDAAGRALVAAVEPRRGHGARRACRRRRHRADRRARGAGRRALVRHGAGCRAPTSPGGPAARLVRRRRCPAPARLLAARPAARRGRDGGRGSRPPAGRPGVGGPLVVGPAAREGAARPPCR